MLIVRIENLFHNFNYMNIKMGFLFKFLILSACLSASTYAQDVTSPVTLNIGSPEDLNKMNVATQRFFFQIPTLPPLPSFPMPTMMPDLLDMNPLWMPDRQLSYKFENGFQNEELVALAISEIERDTCITFKKITDYLYVGNHVIIRSSADRCSSSIGRQGNLIGGGQELYLSDQCKKSKAAILHFLLHTMGVFHQHSRTDRSNFLTIISQNITPNKAKNFNINTKARRNTPFDMMSVEQYGILGYSSNGGVTMYATDPMNQGLLIYPRESMSFMDKLNVNKMYGCTDMWNKCNSGINKCQNLGYIGKNCQCVCPPGTSGDVCQNKTDEYMDALKKMYLPYNENVNTTGNISSPDYPTPQTNVTIFTKIITAPKCNNIKLTVADFDLRPRCPNGWCCREGVELKLNGVTNNSKIVCGNELAANSVLFSKGTNMIVFYYKEKTMTNTRRGFQFSTTFVPIPGCT